jgi:hypothetical protein
VALSQPVLASSCLLAEHRYSSYEAFKMRGKAVVIDSPKVFSMSEIVSRADSMVQKGPGRPNFGSYDAGSNNCEEKCLCYCYCGGRAACERIGHKDCCRSFRSAGQRCAAVERRWLASRQARSACVESAYSIACTMCCLDELGPGSQSMQNECIQSSTRNSHIDWHVHL